MRATRFTSAVRSAGLCCAASLLLACEQEPDVVISSTAPLDAGQQQQQQDPPGMNEPPVMNDTEACRELQADNFWLTRVYESHALDMQTLEALMAEKETCVFRVSEANSFAALNKHIFDDPPVQLDPEQTVAICNVFDRLLDGGIADGMLTRYYPWPDLSLLPTYLRLCPGYCESLRLWIEEHESMVLGCFDAGL